MLNKLAEELRVAREEKKFSQAEIAQRIRIDIKFLISMEKGDFSFLPELYIKAYLREYSKILGLDEELIIKKYLLFKEGKDFNPEQSNLSNEKAADQPKQYGDKESIFSQNNDDNETSQKNITKTYKKNLTVYGSITAIMLIAVIYFFFFYDRRTEIIKETSYEEILEESKKRYETTDEPKIRISDSLSLVFYAKDSSWIKAKFDNLSEKEYFLFPRKSLEIKAAEIFHLTIGNYRNVGILLNGTPLTIEQQKGKTARISIDKNGIKIIGN